MPLFPDNTGESFLKGNIARHCLNPNHARKISVLLPKERTYMQHFFVN